MGAEAHREAERTARMGRRTCRAVERTASHPSGAKILTRGFSSDPPTASQPYFVRFFYLFHFSAPGSGLTTICTVLNVER